MIEPRGLSKSLTWTRGCWLSLFWDAMVWWLKSLRCLERSGREPPAGSPGRKGACLSRRKVRGKEAWVWFRTCYELSSRSGVMSPYGFSRVWYF